MKRSILLSVVALSLLSASCTKENTYIINVPETPKPEKTIEKSVLGKWAYSEDMSRSFTVDSVDTMNVYLTFDYQIDSPNPKNKISLDYSRLTMGDTLEASFPAMYPDVRFYMDECGCVHGYMVEWKKIPSQGDWKPLTRI